MKLKLKIKGKEYEIEISESKEGEVKINVGGKEFVFGKDEEKEKVLIAKPTFPKRDFSKKEIKAPITGIISEIFVKEGYYVKKNQKLLLLSAMKMENEIVSDFEGKVEKILVKKDQKVKGGETLIVLR